MTASLAAQAQARSGTLIHARRLSREVARGCIFVHPPTQIGLFIVSTSLCALLTLNISYRRTGLTEQRLAG
jgi:hypothetical protein